MSARFVLTHCRCLTCSWSIHTQVETTIRIFVGYRLFDKLWIGAVQHTRTHARPTTSGNKSVE